MWPCEAKRMGWDITLSLPPVSTSLLCSLCHLQGKDIHESKQSHESVCGCVVWVCTHQGGRGGCQVVVVSQYPLCTVAKQTVFSWSTASQHMLINKTSGRCGQNTVNCYRGNIPPLPTHNTQTPHTTTRVSQHRNSQHTTERALQGWGGWDTLTLVEAIMVAVSRL